MTSTSQSASSDSTSICSELARKPEDSFPNRLLDPVGAVVLPRRGVLLAVLTLFCLAMQSWSASRWHIVWPDTVDYIRVSQALDRGDPQPMVDQFGLNVYPLILTALHRLGGDWEVAGQAWSVAMASLVVLPLFGWLRRQFDDVTAAAGCALYAIHPKLLISSPLVIRDPTFWFLLTLTLYLAWRAVLELKPWLFAAAGVALALAIHTRTEGLFLLAPLVLWAVFRWPAVRGHRLRLALGGLLCLAMIPAWVLLMNATLLRGHPWVLVHSIRFPGVILGDESPDASARAVSAAGHLQRQESFVGHRQGCRPDGPQDKEISPAAGRVAGPPLRALAAAAAALAADAGEVRRPTRQGDHLCLRIPRPLGAGLWRRVFFRRDQQAMLLFGVLLWLAIALRMRVGVDIRYYLPGVIASTGYAGLGLLWIAKWICRLTAARVDWTGPRRAALCCALVAVVFAPGDAATGAWRSGGSWCSTPIWENGSSTASARTSGSSAPCTKCDWSATTPRATSRRTMGCTPTWATAWSIRSGTASPTC